jgi:hypothetical protein
MILELEMKRLELRFNTLFVVSGTSKSALS